MPKPKIRLWTKVCIGYVDPKGKWRKVCKVMTEMEVRRLVGWPKNRKGWKSE